MARPHRTDPATDCVEYDGSARVLPATARAVSVYLTNTAAAASLTIRMADGTSRQFTVKDGWEKVLNFKEIVASSNVAVIQVSY